MPEPRTTQRKFRHHRCLGLSRTSHSAVAVHSIPAAVRNPGLLHSNLVVVGGHSLDFRGSSHTVVAVASWDRRTFEAEVTGSFDCSSVGREEGTGEAVRTCRPSWCACETAKAGFSGTTEIG